MTKYRWYLLVLGLAFVSMTPRVHAQIVVTLNDKTTGATTTIIGTPNQAMGGGFSNGSFTYEASLSNNPGTGGQGTLSSTFTYMPASGVDDIMVTVTEETPFVSPSSPASFNVQNTATVSSNQTFNFTGSAQINNGTPLAAVSSNSSGSQLTNSATAPSTSTYSLVQSFELTAGTTAPTVGSVLSVSLTTLVSPGISPASVPEPSVLVLTALSALGLGGLGIRRCRRDDSADLTRSSLL